MNSQQLFDFIIKHGLLANIKYIKAFFTTPLIKEDKKYETEVLLIKDGKVFLKHDNEKLELSVDKYPILDYMDEVELYKEDWETLEENTVTTIGIAMLNFIMLELPFRGLYSFNNGAISKGIEDKIAEDLLNRKIAINQLEQFVDNCEYLKTWNRYFVQAASEKTLLPPEGIQEKKEAIVRRMIAELGEDAFKSQVNIVKLEEELKKIDAEWLKDDPTFGIVTSGKVLDNSRKELFLTVGGIESFDDEVSDSTFVINSLLEGWPEDKELFTAMVNALRAGSLARAIDTQNGGLLAKMILRAIGSYIIKKDVDCGTKQGSKFSVTTENIETIKNRHILFNNETVLVDTEEKMKQYLNKDILIRTPKYCNLVGENYCGKCVNKLLNDNVDGIKNEVTTVAQIVLYEAMKKLHNTVKSLVRLDRSIFS